MGLFSGIRRAGRAAKFVAGIMPLIRMNKQLGKSNPLVGKVWSKRVAQSGDLCFLVFQDKEYTFAEADREINRIMRSLEQMEVKRGDVVALFMDNCPAFIFYLIALSKMGAVASLMNTLLKGDSLVACIEAVEPKVVIAKEHFHSACGTASIDCEVHVISQDEESPVIDASGGADHEDEQYSTTQTEAGDMMDVAMYIHTSGTSGLPKAAKMSNFRLVGLGYNTSFFFGVKETDRLYVTLPLYHTSAIMSLMMAIVTGASIGLSPRFSASGFWTECIALKATCIQYIGELPRYLVAQPPSAVDKEHNIRLAYGNGMRKDVWERFEARFGIPNIIECYSSTEGNAALINNFGVKGACGYLSPLLEYFYPVMLVKVDNITGDIVRDDNGMCIPVADNEPGQLVGLIDDEKLERRFDGYRDKDASDRRVIRSVRKEGDKFFSTGDLLYRDAEGFVFFSDRIGDTFRFKGENFSTTQISEILDRGTPHLREQMVFGVSVPEVDGKVCMLYSRLGNLKDESDEVEVLKTMMAHARKNLPKNALPVFVRVTSEPLFTTGTYKNITRQAQKESFHVSQFTATADRLFYFDHSSEEAEPRLVDEAFYDTIVSGALAQQP